MLAHTLIVNLPNQAYPLYIGENLLPNSTLFNKHIRAQQVMIVTNSTVAELYLPTLLNTLNNFECETLILPDGEKYKTLDSWIQILDKLVASNFNRDTTLIALGGGVVGDMAGFAAASYQRGIDFIQVPTTLLAQVDSSIGGKTSVNHPGGKNMIGAFHQPNAVVIDIATLNTLPTREFHAGFAEIVKAALIKDSHFFTWLEQHAASLKQKNKTDLISAITAACQIKADIVAEDQKEQGVRALLNLGHTFAHAIEHVLGYGVWLHGEAVSVGLVLAAQLSHLKGLITEQKVERIKQLLNALNLPTSLPADLSFEKLLQAMRMDKKVLKKQLRFILLQDLGQAFLCESISEDSLKMLYSNS